jgi:uncharacterized membrane protein YdbT with pleckstrin-like domain
MSFRKVLSSYLIKPYGIHFETQETEEEILIFLREHPIVNVGWITMAIILILLPLTLIPLLMNDLLFLKNLPPGYYVVLPFLWYLGIFGYIFTNFMQWYFNVYIVTNKRVVDIDWYNLLYKKLASAQLEKIQDVNYLQGGLVESFFDYGSIHIQTAGTEPNFDFEHIPQPDHVVREINEILEAKRNNQIL